MFGQPSPEEARARIADGTAWEEFCELLKAAGGILQRDDMPDDPLIAAEGVRYLSRLVRAGLEAFVENHDPAFPVLARMVHETVKLGNDNPDNVYLNAKLDGTLSYRITGERGTVHWLEFATQKGSYGQSRGLPPTGHLDARDMQINEDGSFEIWISTKPPVHGGNWLPMEPETGMILVRQSRLDPEAEVLAELRIEAVDGPSEPSPVSAEQIDAGLRQAGMLVGGAAMIFAEWVEGFQQHLNELPRFDQATSDAMGGVPEIAYYHSYWKLAQDEALVIEVMPPPCDHWNFQLSNHWMESLDYRYAKIHTNSKLATPGTDGSIRLIVAHQDPGLPNWLDTSAHASGAMCFRWVRAEVEEPPVPSCRVVKLSTLMGEG